MIFEQLNSSGFRYNSMFYQNEFENILKGIIICYDCMVESGKLLANNENNIRDVMLDQYLKNEYFKKNHFNLDNYHFDKETAENKGRTDIRVLPINPYIGDYSYYIIECKRLENKNATGDSGLNAEYIKNGICRFVTGYYSSYFDINGVIGFVVRNMDIDTNVNILNSMLNTNFRNDRKEIVNANAIHDIKKINIITDFSHSYTSKHKTITQKEITLYHLMFDLSGNIQ